MPPLPRADLAVQHWSVGVQLVAVCLLAFFFLALTRTVRLAEVRLWAWAWLSDALAVAAIFAGAFFAVPWWVLRLSAACYAAGKTGYVLLLVGGAQYHLRPGVHFGLGGRGLAGLLAGWSLALAVFAPQLVHVQLAQSLMVGAVLTAGAAWVLRHPRAQHSRWLAWAMLVEGLLFLHYVPLLLPVLWGGAPLAHYLYLSSFYDTGAELFVAMGTLVALQSSATEHLRHLNEELLASHDRLRQVADLDPLTALANRRTLRGHLEQVTVRGAALIFVDIENFKRINDRHGHIAGDACLKRVAAALTHVFRAEDGLFRWGGDEFLVVATGLDFAGAQSRVDELRSLVAQRDGDAPPLGLWAGIALLPPNGEPDAALREADERLVADKQRHGAVD